MPRYVSNISEIILDAVDVQQIVSEYVQLKRAGANVKGLCPFHNEKSPSFVVSQEKQMYHCFGCGAAGNAIGFVMAIENLDFLDAIELLADRAHIDLEQYVERNNNSPEYKPENKDLKAKYYEINKHAARFFYSNLKKSNEAQDYFKNREISDETIRKFGLGYAFDEWNELLNYLAKPPYTKEELETVGLIISKKEKNGYYDRFRGRVMFPIIDVHGKVVGFGGRILNDGQPKYLNSPETPIFNKSNTLYNLNLAKNELSQNKTLIVVEGYMDVIALYQRGIKNVVATLGTALTGLHGRLLKRYAEEIILAYDSDEAGQKATIKGVEILEKSNLKVKVLQLPNGLDPDDYIKQFGVDKFNEKIMSSINYADYKLKLLKGEHNLDYEDGRMRFVADAIEVIKNIEGSVAKEHYCQKISKWTRVDEAIIKRGVFSQSNKSANQPKLQNYNQQNQQPIRKLNKSVIIETRLMYLSLLNKRNFDRIFELISFEDIQDKRVKKIMTFLIGYYQVIDKFSIEECIDHLGIEEIKYIQKVLKHSIANLDEESEKKEILANAKTFESEVLDNKIVKLMNLIISIKESDDISDIERNKNLKLLNTKLVEFKQSQERIMKELGR